MIYIKNRQMIIPPEERILGTEGDEGAASRTFSIPRYNLNEIDLSGLIFTLEMKYISGAKNTTAFEDKIVSDDDIRMTWLIRENDMQEVGTVLINIKATDLSGAIKWRSQVGVFYISDAPNVAENYTGDLTIYEAILARCIAIENQQFDVGAATTAANNAAASANSAASSANAGANLANSKANEIESRFNALTSGQQEDSEVIDARKGFASLRLKVDDNDNLIANIFGDFAEVYSPSSTYALGTYCIYNNKFYKCTTAITTAEVWNADHWTVTTVGAENLSLKSQIAGVNDNLAGVNGFKILPENTANLNDITCNAIIHCRGIDSVTLDKGYPVANLHCSVLAIVSPAAFDGCVGFELVVYDGSNGVYIRYAYGSWASWIKIK